MPKKPIRNRLLPYKILVMLLYGRHSFVRKKSPLDLEISLGPAARFTRVTNNRLRDALSWLATNSLIELELRHGEATVRIKNPLELST